MTDQIEQQEQPVVEQQPIESDSPWAADLKTALGEQVDPEVFKAVDGYLREKWQPHVTQLEQTVSQSQEAVSLYNDLVSDPTKGIASVANALLDDDLASSVIAQLSGEPSEPEKSEEQPATQQVPSNIPLEQLPPEVQDFIAQQQRTADQQEYDGLVDETIAKYPDLKISKALFHPFVNAADGDFDLAAQMYGEFDKQFAKDKGIENIEELNLNQEEAPAVLDSSGNPVPPTEPVYETYSDLDRAVDDFFAQQRSAPNVVGA